jgi:predicted MFS family arabinose efflux permease
VLYGFEHVSGRDGKLILILGLLLLGLFLFHAFRKKSEALIDLALFKIRIFSIAATTQFLSNGVMYAGQLLIPLYLITGCEFSASKAGWIMAPMGIGALCISPMMGFLTDKWGCRRVVAAGIILNTLGTLPILWMIQNEFSSVLMAICLIARGAGQTIIGVPAISAAYSVVPKNKVSGTGGACLHDRFRGGRESSTTRFSFGDTFANLDSPLIADGSRSFFW